jgi:hypothetical protein
MIVFVVPGGVNVCVLLSSITFGLTYFDYNEGPGLSYAVFCCGSLQGGRM